MKQAYYALVFAGVFGLGVVGGWWYKTPPSPVTPVEKVDVPASISLPYTNTSHAFRLSLPTGMTVIEETDKQVSFGVKDAQDLTGFGVAFEKTSFSSTTDWLSKQPLGTDKQAGYQPLLVLQNGMMIVAQSLIVDQNKTKPVYGKTVLGVMVGNGTLYTIRWHNEVGASDIPKLDADILASLSSFQFVP